MESRDLERRAEIARRLKAARWLAGTVERKRDGKGKAGYEIVALTAEGLAKRQPLQENGITAHKLGAIERMERPTPPMELQAIAEALELPPDWFRAATATEKPDPEELIAQLAKAYGFGVSRLETTAAHGAADAAAEAAQPPLTSVRRSGASRRSSGGPAKRS